MSQGPPIPKYILRGHSASINVVLFVSANAFLASGDSDGWLVIWSLASKRPAIVWKAHEGGITGIKSWDKDRLITHGRDHKLRVWEVNYTSEDTLSTKLPVDGALDDQPRPWLLHSMDVSTLNFCAFSTCYEPWVEQNTSEDGGSLLIASPNGLDAGGIDIFQLPTQRRVSQLFSKKSENTGMVMAVLIYHSRHDGTLRLLSGYEDGQVMVHCHEKDLDASKMLSLSMSPTEDCFFTSSADAQICKFAVPLTASVLQSATPVKTINTKHAGQQSLSIRSDDKIFATAGWDARVRVYSTKSLKELAVLRWHKDGCSSTALAEIFPASESQNEESGTTSNAAGQESALDIIKRERSVKAQNVHWLAAGGKDGKISLWDIY